MEEDFYVSLVSNTCTQIFTNNRAVSFTNSLAKRIELLDHWEVALFEIHFSMILHNVYGKESRILVKRGTQIIKKCMVDQNRANDIYEVFDQLNENCAEELVFEMLNGRVVITPVKTGDSVRFSKPLAQQLGFPAEVDISEDQIVAPKEPDFNFGLPTTAHITCDIIATQFVGNTLSPLLRIITLEQSRYTHGGSGMISFSRPIYVPVMVKDLHRISVDIRGPNGKHLPFIHGTSSVVLYFRKRST